MMFLEWPIYTELPSVVYNFRYNSYHIVQNGTKKMVVLWYFCIL
jgi:hypothetical protein